MVEGEESHSGFFSLAAESQGGPIGTYTPPSAILLFFVPLCSTGAATTLEPFYSFLLLSILPPQCVNFFLFVRAGESVPIKKPSFFRTVYI